MQNRNKKIGVVLLIIVVLGAGFYLAYRRGTLGGSGSRVMLQGIGSESKVFVDNERVRPSVRMDHSIVSVPPGLRDILVSRDGYWPWLKQISVGDNETITLTPFLFPRDTIRQEIKADDPEYEKLVALAQNSELPAARDKLISTDGTVTVWKEHGALDAAWRASSTPAAFFCTSTCETHATFLGIAESVREIAFWGERPDVVIVAMGKEIYALELDRRNVQNFQPIYRGSNPEFTVLKNGELYVTDNGRLYFIKTD